MRRVLLVVHADYLCPWCHLADHRLRRLAREDGALELSWKSFLLRPRPGRRDLASFVRYTRSWARPAEEPDAPVFRPWTGAESEGPPSHSVPPQVAAKAAARRGPEAFARLHARLLAAYFEERRDITAAATLRALWAEAGLPAAAFEACEDPALREAVVAEDREARELGITGVPAVRPEDREVFVLGAQPLTTLRRWVARLREGVLDGDAAARSGA